MYINAAALLCICQFRALQCKRPDLQIDCDLIISEQEMGLLLGSTLFWEIPPNLSYNHTGYGFVYFSGVQNS